jgi:hypothetical protein
MDRLVFAFAFTMALSVSLFGLNQERYAIKDVYLGMDIKDAESMVLTKYGKTSLDYKNVDFRNNNRTIKTNIREGGKLFNRKLVLTAFSGYNDKIYFIDRKTRIEGNPIPEELKKQLIAKYGEPTIQKDGRQSFYLCYGDCDKDKNDFMFGINYRAGSMNFKAVDYKLDKMFRERTNQIAKQKNEELERENLEARKKASMVDL